MNVQVKLERTCETQQDQIFQLCWKNVISVCKCWHWLYTDTVVQLVLLWWEKNNSIAYEALREVAKHFGTSELRYGRGDNIESNGHMERKLPKTLFYGEGICLWSLLWDMKKKEKKKTGELFIEETESFLSERRRWGRLVDWGGRLASPPPGVSEARSEVLLTTNLRNASLEISKVFHNVK